MIKEKEIKDLMEKYMGQYQKVNTKEASSGNEEKDKRMLNLLAEKVTLLHYILNGDKERAEIRKQLK